METVGTIVVLIIIIIAWVTHSNFVSAAEDRISRVTTQSYRSDGKHVIFDLKHIAAACDSAARNNYDVMAVINVSGSTPVCVIWDQQRRTYSTTRFTGFQQDEHTGSFAECMEEMVNLVADRTPYHRSEDD